ncbi:QcrA and Rieske domain-containing protein [Arundinibacter roseus]|uniref:Rieske (2Fe-2S) protein n=1 Tax=Arundinibacter roseus TaxID=2070510 RepID=A0A4R4K836_9BACT|nr:Rieske (2Fe-2S) protein [Arundinibacter roseus]TDB63720.1 Rieske (2Fe-2S) protein [Arundinibacter roseus]
MKTNNQETLKRGEFLRSLGMSGAALMAFYCLGTLTACSSGEDDPAPVGGTGGTNTGGGTPATGVTGTTSGNAINFTVDLTSSAYSKLKTEGEFAIIGDTIVVATAGQKYVALSKRCTHEGSTVTFRKNSNDIWCSSHSSEFNLDGSVKRSPAVAPLTVFTTTLSQDGNTLTVKV